MDIKITEEGLEPFDLQKRVWNTYSFFLKTAILWAEKQRTDPKASFKNFVSERLILSVNEINVLLNEGSPELEDFLDAMSPDLVTREPDPPQWPSENYFSEYIQFQGEPYQGLNGFSSSKG